MTLTKAQQHQISLAPNSQKSSMRANFSKQNAGQVPGRTRDQKQRGNTSRMTNMPAPNRAREMPDLTKGNWSQTPATNTVMAPRGFGYYDAFANNPFEAATHMSIGPATPIVGTTIASSNIETNDYNLLDSGQEGGSIIVIVYPSTSSIQARGFKCSSSAAADTAQSISYNSPQLENDEPLDAIPTRCSVRIRNWTQEVAQGGVVRVLRMTTGVALATSQVQGLSTNGDLATFMEGVRTHARTRSYSGTELRTAMQKNCTVVDQSRALWFFDWGNVDNGVPVAEIPWANALGWDPTAKLSTFTRQLYQPSYTPIVFMFEPFVASYAAPTSGGASIPQGNRYELTIRSQFLAHYPQGTMLANMAIDPKANPNEMIKFRNHEESKGSVMERIVGEIKGGAKWGWNHRDDIISIVGPMIQGMSKVV